MIDIQYLDGKALAIILWGNNKEGKSDIQICYGTARKKGQKIYFERPTVKTGFYLDHDLVSQIKIPDNSLRPLAKDAQFVLSLSVDTLSEDDDIELIIGLHKRA